MLSPTDAAVVARDPAIPGLALLLDDDAVADKLHRFAPNAGIQAAHARYLRYKPGTSCLVAYQVTTTAGTIDIYAKAYCRSDRKKMLKHIAQPSASGPLGAGRFSLAGFDVVIYVMPNDRRLAALGRLSDPAHHLIRRLVPDNPSFWDQPPHTLRYKPERRYVAQLRGEAGEQAVIKLYTGDDYRAARRAAKAMRAHGSFRVARLLGHSDRHHALAFEWLNGRSLRDVLDEQPSDARPLQAVGAVLAALHARSAPNLTQREPQAEIDTLEQASSAIRGLCARWGTRAERLASRLAPRLRPSISSPVPIHGDFYSDQVVLGATDLAFLDFDRAALGDPAADVGSFSAHLHYQALRMDYGATWATTMAEALLHGYLEHEASRDVPSMGNRVPAEELQRRVSLFTAAGLLRLASEPFRFREPAWLEQMHALVAQAEEIADQNNFAA